MQLFLGDYVTMGNYEINDAPPTMITGQVRGIVLHNNKEIDRVYLAGIEEPFYMDDGWKFVMEIDDDTDTE